MDSQTFVEGYRRPRRPHIFHEHAPDIAAQLQGPQEWASFFDRQLFSLLKGAHTGSPSEINRQLDNYEYGWMVPFLEDSIRESHDLAFSKGAETAAINNLTIHILNEAFLPLWRHALTPEIYPRLSIEEIEMIQTDLATRGVDLRRIKNDVWQRQKIEKTPPGLAGAIDLQLSGQLSEVDTAIVFLKIMKKYPNLVFLPASPQFESARIDDRSIDFIVIDIESRQSRGLQVKTFIESIDDPSKPNEAKHARHRPIRKYNDKYVTLIDATVELGNFKVHFTPGKEVSFESDPGLTSVNFLKDSNNADLLQAQRNIEGRILHDLYKN
jgi:hypothetical protein